MRWTKWSSLLLLCLYSQVSDAQVVGGLHAFEFLRMPTAPHISALGGINVANPEDDIAFTMQNPSLMRPGLHNQLGLNYNAYYAGIKVMNLQYGYHVENIKTSFALGIQYLNYGDFLQTDNIGNQNGTYSARDYAISLAAARQYKEHWRYGATLKFAQSTLSNNASATGILADVGVTYYDTASLWNLGIVAKNMGFMAEKYTAGNTSEPMPFDLQIGISKRFKHLPLRLMATIHHLYEWDIRYNNPADAEGSNLFGQEENTDEESHFADKLFRHFIFGAEITLGKRVMVSAAYNHLRRSELVIKDKTGMAGFSFGVGVNLNKFQVHYARTFYHVAGAYNEFGLNMSLNKLFGIGKVGNEINWTKVYPDWQ